ncbi:MAG: hypothetical protein ACFFDN_14840 [Candidatus Hodarchaeota archaeon]
MKSINLEEKMEIIHHQMNQHKQIKGSILIRDNGLHISSKLPEKSESRKISAHIATIFRHISKKIRSNEVKIRLENGVNLFIKQIPNKKILLTTITDNAATPNMKKLMDRYSRKFHNIFS